MNEKADMCLTGLGTVLSVLMILTVAVGLREMAGGLDRVWNGSYPARSALLLGPLSILVILAALVLVARWEGRPVWAQRLVFVVNALGLVSSCVATYWAYRYIAENGLNLGAFY